MRSPTAGSCCWAAALTAPAALSLITTTFTEQVQRTRALGVYSLAGATGYTGGLVLSGLLTDVSWRLVFFLPVPLALLVVALTPLVIPRSADSARGFDALGAATVTGGVLLVVYALYERCARPTPRPSPGPARPSAGSSPPCSTSSRPCTTTPSPPDWASHRWGWPSSWYRLAFLTAGSFSVLGVLGAALGIRATTPARQPAPIQS